MASWELQLISAIIKTGDLRTVLDEGITKTHLGNLEARTCFEALVFYYQDHDHFGEVMSAQLLLENFPSLALPKPKQSLLALCKKVRIDYLQRNLRILVEGLADDIDDDPEEALKRARVQISELDEQHISQKDANFAEEALDIIAEEYALTQENEGVLGIPFPWKEMNEQVGGIEEGNLVVFYGIPKSGKTWTALHVGAHAYEMGYRVMVFSKEMSLKQLFKRMACLLCGLSYRKLRKAELPDDELSHLLQMMEFLKEEAKDSKTHRKLIFTKGLKDAESSILSLADKIKTYQPDLVVLDSAYQMAKSRKYDHQERLSSDLKEVADFSGVPIVAVMQANIRKAFEHAGSNSTPEMGFSGSWTEDADLLVYCVLTEAAVASQSLHIRGFREDKANGIRINFNPAVNLSFMDYDLKDMIPPKKKEPGDDDETKEKTVRSSYAGRGDKRKANEAKRQSTLGKMTAEAKKAKKKGIKNADE
jgi:replicative DNA helicase